MLGAVDVNAELDALQEQFVAVNDRIFTDLSNPPWPLFPPSS